MINVLVLARAACWFDGLDLSQGSGRYRCPGDRSGEIPESFRQLSHQLVRFAPRVSMRINSPPLQQLPPDFIIIASASSSRTARTMIRGGRPCNPDQRALPHALAQATAKVLPMAKVLQIATDCVYSGKTGNYDEAAKHDALDVYGKTKSLGEVNARHVLNIRCSIIGPELKGRLSLLEWFLSQPTGARVNGYAHHQWNGITTLQFAELCVMLMRGRTLQSGGTRGAGLTM